MTYRFVPQRWLRAAQLLTLAATVLVGFSVLLTPPQKDVKLTVIEEGMAAHPWAYSLIAAAGIALLAEVWMGIRNSQTFTSLVAYCHIICCGVTVGLSASALVSVIERAPWNFGAPSIGLLLAFWHLLFVKRRPHL